MRHRDFAPLLALCLTLGMVAAASLFRVEAAWGINHLIFLSSAWWIVPGAALVVCVIFWLMPELAGTIVNAFDRLIFERGLWPRAVVAVICGLLFFAFRSPVHFLGDGYTIISNFSNEAGFVHRQTEILSIQIVRLIQGMLGDYSKATAEQSPQLVSCAAGAVTVFNFIVIARYLGRDAGHRVLTLFTLFGSGVLLLFFGYVEFYPLLWAAGSWFIGSALRFLELRRGMWLVVVSFAATVLMHLQALTLLPGLVLVAAVWRYREIRWSRIWLWFGAAAVALGSLYIWLYITRLDFEYIFLPPLTGRPRTPEYAMFSLKHLWDIGNLLLFAFPGVLALGVVWAMRRFKVLGDSVSQFLLLCALGSLAFLFSVDPMLGLARDWDLFAFTLLPPVLWVLYQLRGANEPIAGRFAIGYGTICLAVAILAWAPNMIVGMADQRMYSLLEYYQRKDRPGWVVLHNYYIDAGRLEEADRVRVRWREIHPMDTQLDQGAKALDGGDYQTALTIGQELAAQDPYRWEFLQLTAKAYARLGDAANAEKYFLRALQLSPYMPALRIDLAQLYMRQNDFEKAVELLELLSEYDTRQSFVLEGLGLSYVRTNQVPEAREVAAKMLRANPNDPGGHLVLPVVSISESDLPSARQHFAAFTEYGKAREDYASIRAKFGYLTQ